MTSILTYANVTLKSKTTCFTFNKMVFLNQKYAVYDSKTSCFTFQRDATNEYK